MKGAILEKGETGYTYLKKLFLSIRHAQKDFNWLITDCQCCTQSEAFYQRIFQYDRYGWLSGEELTRMVETEDFQWIWAVLSGFPRHISLAQVLEYDLPYADMYTGFWTNPVSIQHPLAQVEIVPLAVRTRFGAVADFRLNRLGQDILLLKEHGKVALYFLQGEHAVMQRGEDRGQYIGVMADLVQLKTVLVVVGMQGFVVVQFVL